MAGEADVDRAVDAARAALDGAWGQDAATERSRLFHALADAIVANRAELAELEARNVGKAISSVKASSSARLRLPLLRVRRRHDRRPLESDRRLAPLLHAEGARRRCRPDRAVELPAVDDGVEALSCARRGLFGRAQARRSAADGAAARGAGGRGRLSPPARSTSSLATARTTGAYLVGHPGVDKVAFTGSTATGSEIMRLAAPTLKRITLELGGKSPNLIFADAILPTPFPARSGPSTTRPARAARRDRVLVEKTVYDEVVAEFAEKAAAVKMGDPLDEETQMGRSSRPSTETASTGLSSRGSRRGPRSCSAGSLPRVRAPSTRRRCSRRSTIRPRSPRRRSSGRW